MLELQKKAAATFASPVLVSVKKRKAVAGAGAGTGAVGSGGVYCLYV